jgi:signal transduction histidine kinase/ligand-binding sensor domain-containing protein
MGHCFAGDLGDVGTGVGDDRVSDGARVEEESGGKSSNGVSRINNCPYLFSIPLNTDRMDKVKLLYSWLLAGCCIVTAPSCRNRPENIPFPISDSGYAQPVTKPLRFSEPKKISWVTVRSGGIKPAVSKLDIDALPASPFDTDDFRPFTRPPEVVHFNWDSLPGRPFSLDTVPMEPIGFKTYPLPHPALIKAAASFEKSGTNLSVRDIGAAQGILGKITWGLFRDKAGFLWIGTEVGLFRFDGQYTQAYTTGEKFQYVTGMTQDSIGRIWYVSRFGLGRIDLLHGTVDWSPVIATASLSKLLNDDRGRIWVSFLVGGGSAVIDPKRETVRLLDSLGYCGAYPYGLWLDSTKNIWMGGDGGLAIINPEKGWIKQLGRAAGLAGKSLRAITGDRSGRIWVGTFGRGVDAVDIRRGTITHYGPQQGWANFNTLAELVDDRGRLWTGAIPNEVSVLDPEKGIFKRIHRENGVGQSGVIYLVEDERHRMWVGSLTGLEVIDEGGNLVHPLDKIAVQCLYEDGQERIWVGTADGIRILDRAGRSIRYLKKQLGAGNNTTQNMIEVNGAIWVTSYNGFDIIDPARKTMEHFGRKEGLGSDSIYGAQNDGKGNIWLSEWPKGLERLDSTKKTLERAIFPSDVASSYVVDLRLDDKGRMWLSTRLDGVYMIDPEQGTIQILNQEAGLRDTCERILFPDEQGRMWIGTDKGIYIADPRNGTLTNLSTREGLSNNYINSFVSYKGQVLVGTYDKVDVISPPSSASAAWKVGLLAGSDALSKSFASENVNIITREGQYMWSDYGMAIINRIEEEEGRGTTRVVGLNILGRPVYFSADAAVDSPGIVARDRWDSVSGPFNLPVRLRIPYNQNFLQFAFAQEGLLSTDSVWYSYILEGVDKKWSPYTNNAVSENYLNLSPGHYIFKVASRKGKGLWGPPASFVFEIMPPWWETWWAYGLYVVVFCAVVFTFSIFRSRNLTRRNKLLEEKVDLRTQALNQSLNELRAAQAQLVQAEKMASLGELTAGVAHEIQNPLNFVNNFSEVNKELIGEMVEAIDIGDMQEVKALAKDIRENEEKINHHGKRADGIVKGMLQHSRASAGQKEPTDINALADEYFRLSYHGLRARDKSFNAGMRTDLDDRIGKINVIPQDIGRVFLNLFNNAFFAVSEKRKLQPSGYEPAVSVATRKVGDRIEIRVQDNGMGIPQKILDKIFQPFFTTKAAGQGTGLGLSLSYDVIKSHGGEIFVETDEGVGTTFVVRLPVLSGGA